MEMAAQRCARQSKEVVDNISYGATTVLGIVKATRFSMVA
jgi:hypothetical protein